MSMQDLEKAIQRMNSSPMRRTFAGPKPEALIAKAESVLGLVFPPTYRRFLKEFGAGSFGSFEVYGITTENFKNASVPNGIWLTLDERQRSGLPSELVIIGEDGQGGFYCLDSSKTHKQETQVILYQPGLAREEKADEILAESFGTFFFQGIDAQAS